MKLTSQMPSSTEAVGRSEREPVVGADGGGQAVLPEQPHEGLDDRRLLCRFKRFAGEHIARGLVGDRQGVTVATVAEPELPLEVGAPQIVGGGGLRQRRA